MTTTALMYQCQPRRRCVNERVLYVDGASSSRLVVVVSGDWRPVTVQSDSCAACCVLRAASRPTTEVHQASPAGRRARVPADRCNPRERSPASALLNAAADTESRIHLKHTDTQLHVQPTSRL